jgi:hypothetical protein
MGWMTDHVVTLPDRSPHRAVKIGDTMLLLMDTLASVRATRVVVFDPLVRPTVCDECAAAHAEARRIIEAAGGLRAWAASYDRAFWTPVAGVEIEVRVVGWLDSWAGIGLIAVGLHRQGGISSSRSTAAHQPGTCAG